MTVVINSVNKDPLLRHKNQRDIDIVHIAIILEKLKEGQLDILNLIASFVSPEFKHVPIRTKSAF